MNVDREQQREILQALFDEYPWITNELSKKIKSMVDQNPSRAVGNLLYLQMHGLISTCVEITGIGREQVAFGDGAFLTYRYIQCPKLTEKGIDFLLGDEGLSSILNVTTIRIEDASLRQIASMLIEASQISQEEKESAIDGIKRIPLTVLKDWLTGLAGKAMPSHEATLELVRNILQFVA